MAQDSIEKMRHLPPLDSDWRVGVETRTLPHIKDKNSPLIGKRGSIKNVSLTLIAVCSPFILIHTRKKNHCEIFSLSALFDDKNYPSVHRGAPNNKCIPVGHSLSQFFFQRRRREEGRNCSKIWESEVVTQLGPSRLTHFEKKKIGPVAINPEEEEEETSTQLAH